MTAIDLARQTASPHDTGVYPSRTHLFLDDFYIDRMTNTQRVTTHPQHVTDGPVFEPQMPWEGQGFIGRNGIIYDPEEKLFKCWYPCHDMNLPTTTAHAKRRWAYATSEDGLAWERPNLGLVEFEGSTDNNLIRFENVEQFDVVGLLWNVVKDEREPDPTKRYKAIGLTRHPVRPGEITWTGPKGEDEWYENLGRHIGCGLFVGYSSDGLRWTMKEGWAGSGALIMDGTILHGYDKRIRQWVLWQRPRIIPKYRIFGVSFSKDFEDWTFPEFGLVPDEHDPPRIEFDGLSSINSPDGGYIGLLAASGYDGEGFGAHKELPQLVYSRDAKVWTRVCREPIIRPQHVPPTWDDGVICPQNPILLDDDIFIFYYGKNAGHTWGEPTRDGKRMTRSAIGLTKLPRDRWVSITPEPGKSEGELITSLICVANNELHLNAGAANGSLVVEVIDCQTRKPPPGFSLADCDPITTDSLDHTVTWKGNADLTPLIGSARMQPPVGRGLIFRFVLKNAHLYTFSC